MSSSGVMVARSWSFLTDVAFRHEELADLARHLGAHDDVVRGDDAGEGEGSRAQARIGVGPDGHDDQDQENRPKAFHGSKQMYKTTV